MIKIKVVLEGQTDLVGKYKGDICTDICTKSYENALLQVAEAFALTKLCDADGKVAFFREVLKRASKTAEDCDTEDLKDLLIEADPKDIDDTINDLGIGSDKCYDDTW